MRQVLISVGVALQVSGLAVTGWGVRRAWRDFGTEEFWSPVINLLRALGVWVLQKYRILFRRPRSATVSPGYIGLGVHVTAGGRGRKGYRVIPSDQGVEDSITELDQRTRELLERIQKELERVDESLAGMTSEIGALRREVDEGIARLEESDRKVAIGGLRLEAVGLFLLVVGVVVQSLGSVI